MCFPASFWPTLLRIDVVIGSSFVPIPASGRINLHGAPGGAASVDEL